MDANQNEYHMEEEKPTQLIDFSTSHVQLEAGIAPSTIQPGQLNTDNTDSSEKPVERDSQDWRKSHQRRPSQETFVDDRYSAGYDQETPTSEDLNNDSFSNWTVNDPRQPNPNVSDLRVFTAFSILCNPVFGIPALVKACQAQEEALKGNITRAKEINSTAMRLAVYGIGIGVFVGAVVSTYRLMSDMGFFQ